MPTGYKGQRLVYVKSLGKWVDAISESAVDYATYDSDSAALMISFFRWYPDYLADVCRSPDAKYNLELPQRLMMRAITRYRTSYITGCRGLTKTYIVLLTKMIEGMLFPGEKMRYNAPHQNQAVALARQAYAQIKIDYPLLASAWNLVYDRDTMFKMTTDHGSEFTMYVPRGDNCSQTIAEEIGQEGEFGFDIDRYEKDVLPTCRLDRRVNQKPDRVHIDCKHTHISNACSRQNRAFTVHRNGALKSMLFGNKYDGIVLDISWITPLLCGIRSIEYVEDLRNTLTYSDWLREACAKYTGANEDPMVSDENLAKSKRLSVMEDKHCGDLNAIYIVAHDVSYVDTRQNAKCADVVLKLTEYTQVHRRDKYRKQAVYVDNYAPQATDYLQAQKLRQVWERYCAEGGQTTYLVIDAQAYGTSVIEELMKPPHDGSPALCCVNHMAFTELEQPGALPVIYPLKAGGRGATDEDAAMVRGIQSEFEKGYLELLITAVLDGVEAYKSKHGIKDDRADGAIAAPYKNTELLCQQITNLKTKVAGASLKEVRRSKAIQRDIWSALKYAVRFAFYLEEQKAKEKYTAKSSWDSIIQQYAADAPTAQKSGTRANLLALRRR